MSDALSLFGPLLNTLEIILRFWWVWAAPLSVLAFASIYLAYKQNLYKEAISWTLYEIRFPRAVEKSPKAMEQFFSAMTTVRNSPGDFFEYYRDGEVTLWFSLEIASIGGEIKFFIRTPTKHKNVLMANLYSNYPTLEIVETEDYVVNFPESLSALYRQGLEIWGTELMLANSDAYPIRSYIEFENAEETMALDPIGAMLEVLSRLAPGQETYVQILVRPADVGAWKKRGQKIVDEIKKKTGKALEPGAFPIGRTPGETEVLKAVEANLSLPAYETLIRHIFISKKEGFDEGTAKRGVVAALNQYSSPDLNFFKGNDKVATQIKWYKFPYLFPNERLQARKARILLNYKKRKIPEDTGIGKLLSSSIFNLAFTPRVYVLNIRSLATIFHPPTELVVTAPILKRVESKRMGPPQGLPIFEEPAKNE